MTSVVLSSSLLILVVAGLGLLLRARVRHTLIYGLWLLVALRLLVPVDIGVSAFSFRALTEPYVSPAVQEITQLPVSGQDELTQSRQPELFLPPEFVVDAPSQQPIVPQVPEALSIGQLLNLVWLVGAILTALYFLYVNLRFHREALRGAVSVPAEGCPIPVLVSQGIVSPCLVGLFRPRILLTPQCAADSVHRRNVLAHELTHWRHKDNFWALLRCVCLCLHWFNPLVWLAAALSRRDCELACDESTLRSLGDDQRLSYGQTLLSIVSAASGNGALAHTATSMQDSARQLKRRISLIAKKPRHYFLLACVLLLVVGLVMVFVFTGQPETTLPEASGPAVAERMESAWLYFHTPQLHVQAQLPILEGSATQALNDGIHRALLGHISDILGASLQPATVSAIPRRTDPSSVGEYLELTAELAYLSEDVVSVTFTGFHNVRSAAHPEHLFFSLNFSLSTAQQLYFRDLYRIDHSLYDAFAESATEDLLAHMNGQWPASWGSFRESICTWDSFQKGLTLEEGFSWYYTPDGIRISYPTVFALSGQSHVLLPWELLKGQTTLMPLCYAVALLDYQAILEQHLQPEADCSQWEIMSDELLQALDGYNARVSGESAWGAMLQELSIGLTDEGMDDFGYTLYDLNGDNVAELFWVRRDGTILAIFTRNQNTLVLLDCFHSRYAGWITQTGQLATHGSGGADWSSYKTFSLPQGGTALQVETAFSMEGSDYFEGVGTQRRGITEARFRVLYDEHTRAASLLSLAPFFPMTEFLPN